MVKAIVTHIGQQRPVCYARPALREAGDAHERKDLIAAGCWLHEATRRYLLAMCTAHKIKPAKSLDLITIQLIHAKQLTEEGAQWLRDAIMYGELSRDCRYTMPGLLEVSIGLVHVLLDHSPELELPKRGGRV